MPPTSNYRQLMQTDRRKQWKDLKAKHSKAITKAKVNFDLKLGPALDKYQTQVDKLTKLSATTELSSMQVDPVYTASKALKTIVDSYHDKVKLLDEPARKELAALLTAIDNDCLSWEKLAVNTMGTLAKGTTDAQKKAAAGLQIPLDNIRAMSLTLVTRGERAHTFYLEFPQGPRKEAAELTSHVVEAARLAGPAAHELANAAGQVIAGSNYELFKTRAEAASHLVRRLRDAIHAFDAGWAFGATPVMTMAGDTDAMALHGNHNQTVSDCDDVLNKIAHLP